MSHKEERSIKKIKIGILLVLAALMLVSVASADTLTGKVVSSSSDGYYGIKLANGTVLSVFCAEENLYVYEGVTYTFTVYDSRTTRPVTSPPSTQATWNKINYVINHPVTPSGRASWHEIQAAVWYFMGTAPPWSSKIEPVNSAIYQDLVNAANTAAGANYVPGPGDRYAVILKAGSEAQASFYIETIPEIPVPEFPTVALPVGMIIGILGLVQVIRSREE